VTAPQPTTIRSSRAPKVDSMMASTEGVSLAEARAIGRKRRRQGRLWPMPVRGTDVGHIYVDVTVRPMAGSRKKWTGKVLVDTGATDTFLPRSVLHKLGIEPVESRAYELADGRWQQLGIGFGVVQIQDQSAGATLVFAGDDEEPLLGVTVLESTGFMVDPRKERLVPRPPKRKSSSLGRRTPPDPLLGIEQDDGRGEGERGGADEHSQRA
jgi:clan AA aspartic protease